MPKKARKTKTDTKTPESEENPVAVKSGRKKGVIEIPDKVTGARWIAALLDIAVQNLQAMAERKEVPGSDDEGMWPVLPNVHAYINILKNEAKGDSAALKRFKREQAEADAEASRIELAKKKGELVLKEDAQRFWTDGIVRLRQIIDEASYLNANQKARLTADIKKSRLAKVDNT